MGTNYYAVLNRSTTYSPFHIGKVSYGWLFNFQWHDEPYEKPPIVWKSYKQVKEWLYEHVEVKKDYVIMDEYDNQVSFDAFFAMVDEIQNDEICKNNKSNFIHSRNVDGYRFYEGEFE